MKILNNMNTNWKFYTELDFDNTNVNCYNIDTRDFYGSEGNFEYKIDNFEYVLKHTEKYLYSKEEVISILNRLFAESGGKGKWRMLDLKSNNEKVLNWNLKYIRVIRTSLGFILCNLQNEAIEKNLIDLPVDQEYLNKY